MRIHTQSITECSLATRDEQPSDRVQRSLAEVLGEAEAEAAWNDVDINVQRTCEAFAFARPGRARRAALEVARNPKLELKDLLSEGDFRDRMNVDGALSRAMHSAAEAHVIDEITSR